LAEESDSVDNDGSPSTDSVESLVGGTGEAVQRFGKSTSVAVAAALVVSNVNNTVDELLDPAENEYVEIWMGRREPESKDQKETHVTVEKAIEAKKAAADEAEKKARRETMAENLRLAAISPLLNPKQLADLVKTFPAKVRSTVAKQRGIYPINARARIAAGRDGMRANFKVPVPKMSFDDGKAFSLKDLLVLHTTACSELNARDVTHDQFLDAFRRDAEVGSALVYDPTEESVNADAAAARELEDELARARAIALAEYGASTEMWHQGRLSEKVSTKKTKKKKQEGKRSTAVARTHSANGGEPAPKRARRSAATRGSSGDDDGGDGSSDGSGDDDGEEEEEDDDASAVGAGQDEEQVAGLIWPPVVSRRVSRAFNPNPLAGHDQGLLLYKCYWAHLGADRWTWEPRVHLVDPSNLGEEDPARADDVNAVPEYKEGGRQKRKR
jgi:hypothetical protein